jgi:hypothetical protein
MIWLTVVGSRSAGCTQSTFKLLNFQFTNGSKNGVLTELIQNRINHLKFITNRKLEGVGVF